MAKLKTGEWFQKDGCIGVVVSARPDWGGYVLVSYTTSAGMRFNNWPDKSLLDVRERPGIERFVSFRSAKRSDGYRFYALYAPGGSARTAVIVAGCRAFTIADAKAHWKTRDRYYPVARLGKDKELNTWSLAYVKKFEAHLKLVRASSLDLRLKRSAAAVRAMTPKQREAMLRKQRESWVRGEMGLEHSSRLKGVKS